MVLNAMAYSLDNAGPAFSYYVENFNDYANDYLYTVNANDNNCYTTANEDEVYIKAEKRIASVDETENGRCYVDGGWCPCEKLHVKIKINFISNTNSTLSFNNMALMVENLLKKKDVKYDIIFYDNGLSSIYGPYLLNLDKYLPKEHIDMYNHKILSQIGYYNDYLVGLPSTIDFSALYTNKVLLDKHNKPIPKTWDELIETSKYILERERNLYNNTDLIAYNGLFGDEIFKGSLDYTILKIFDFKAIFVKMYYIPGFIFEGSPYVLAPMPGIKEGVSGTIQVGYNFGIANSIDKDKLEPAIKAIEYMTSREVQKELVLKEAIVSGITSLYEEKDVCSNINFCDFYKNPQIIMKPNNVFKSDDYFDRYTSYFYEFLYKNEKASDVLKKMNDLTKIYTVSLNKEDTSLGIFVVVVFTLLIICIVASMGLPFMKKYNNIFALLPKPYWIVLLMGIIMILSTGYTKLGTITVFKCHLNNIFLSLGFTLYTFHYSTN
ncbi:hypothetical protein PIROE2DRAFT_61201 [Piromyces sp. E2]|nr:hypothetical protein PIROE2DRAFT_61201 [Piromyces sp. E2]|eukprot:OUM63572.1 hypothetical protein PIROE2DRAFT_61201 [Piromyces sp. E2]